MRKLTTIICSCILLFTGCNTHSAPDIEIFKSVIDELSSEKYQGRGYACDGVIKAGEYIESQFIEAGVDEVTLQPFCIDVNTFPGEMEMAVDGKQIVPGLDFVMREYSPGIKGSFNLYFIDTAGYDAEKIFKEIAKDENENSFVVCDFYFTYKHKDDFNKLQSNGGAANAGLILTWETPLKFYKAYAEKVIDKPIIWTTSQIIKDAKRVEVNIENKFLEDYESNNILAKVSGKRDDSCFVFLAHYDHLGNLGRDVYYPGANDNASGTAALISYANYYANNRPEFDIYFLAVSGEDTNLRGSTYFVNNPLIPLESIKYLINMDMVGDNNPIQYCEVSETGTDGFELMEQINRQEGYIDGFNRGELAANSDHYPFALKGVPCILFENENGDAFPYYHTTQDNIETVKYTLFEPLSSIITTFIERY